jgi:two-component system cell cycle sensor histidine kinase/response regulator CckA
MTLRTERIPPTMEEVFAAAEAVVAKYFGNLVHAPDKGSIEISGERYILVRAASLSVEFFSLVYKLYGDDRQCEAAEFARNILFDLSHAVGKSDAKNFHARMNLVDPVARISAGPVYFAHAGWAFVDPLDLKTPKEGEEYSLVFEHSSSFEASAWLEAKVNPLFPVCIMSSGYSSGWCAESFGFELVAAEITCRACGDATCRFVMAPPSIIEEVVERHRPSTSVARLGRPGPPGTPQIPDLFARKRIEDELRRSRDELELRVKERTAELEQANALLKEEVAQRAAAERQLVQAQKLEAVGRLAGGIAHDFNNMLGVILGRSSMVQARLGRDNPVWEDMEAIRLACRQGASLTQHMISFSRGAPVDVKPLELNELVREFASGVLPLVGERIELDVQVGDESLWILADQAQLEQVLINLVVNSGDAMPGGGNLRLRTARTELAADTVVSTATLKPGDYAVIVVSDTGTGIAADAQTKIFDPFFSTKAPGRGTGLGLSTVFGIVQRSQGGIDLTSVVGEGTTFTLYFPIAAAPAEQFVPRQSRPKLVVPGDDRILLVEDRAELRDTIEQGLVAAGYQVIAVGDPVMALTLVEKGDLELDVLVTDLVMPKLGGRELAARVAAVRPDVRAVFMSGNDSEPTLGTDAGEQQPRPELRKPFSIAALTHAIQRALGDES